jgi:hypothetical protein
MRLLLATAIVLSSAALTTLALAAPAHAETRQYDLSGFRKIEASKGFTIEFTQAPTFSVSVDSRHNNLDRIVIEKVGDTLRIDRPKGFCTRTSRVTRDGGSSPKVVDDGCLHHEVEDIVTISAPDLDALELHAAIEFNAKKLNLDKLRIDAEAAIKINIADLRVDMLDVEMDAASKLVVAGACSKLVLDLGAASSVDTRNLKCREADIDAGVASKVHAFASERATAKAGISTSILISGKPKTFTKSIDRFSSTVSLAD